tara:strand:+ start:505 stop:1119 length:615 start_codon:yes stop_codon:yes gene_type:complete
MKFSFGGSTGKYWNQFADHFRFGGEGGKFLTTLTKGFQGLKEDKMFNKWGNEAVNLKLLGQKEGVENLSEKLMKGSGSWSGAEEWYMDKSRKLSPLWEGGLTGVGGSTKQFLDWGEDVALKTSHHLFGTDVEGYGSRYSGGGGSASNNVAVSEAEDPSLINQGNWTRPGEIESFLRREELVNRGVLAHDLTKTQRGRQKVETLA